jgi:sentrin-specific protease 1
MGNAISHRYEDVKKKAISSLQYFNEEKEKQVLDDKEEDDSSVEVIEIVDNDSAEMDCVVNFRDSASSMDSVLTSTKVESTGRMSNSLRMNQQPLHRQLYEDSARKRNNTLSGLSFKIDLLEKKRNTFGIYRQVKKPEKVVVTEPFVPLTKEEEVDIKRALLNSNRRKVLVTHADSSLEISGEMLQCLRPGAWLNDEVINLYLELLKEREKREPKKFLKCHFFNTFFYKKINGRSGYDYKSVRRWTTQRKLGYSLFDCDKIFVPIHKDVHWCLAVISKKEEKFQYLDSLRGRDKEVMKVLAKYIVDEVKDKNGKDIDVDSWKHEYVEDLPDQENGFDCGMFMIKYIDFYSRNVGLCFNQEHMPYFRLRTAKEILKLRAE